MPLDAWTLTGFARLAIGLIGLLYYLFTGGLKLAGFGRTVNLLDESLKLRAAFSKAALLDQVKRMNDIIKAQLDLNDE